VAARPWRSLRCLILARTHSLAARTFAPHHFSLHHWWLGCAFALRRPLKKDPSPWTRPVRQTGTQATERLDAPVVPLRYFPCCVHVKLDRFDSDTECLRFLDDEPCARHGTDGIQDSCNEGRNFASRVAIEPFTNRCPWSIEIKVLDVSVKVQRVQLPFVCASASTLHFFKELRVFRA
jgi:hypothetical protein